MSGLITGHDIPDEDKQKDEALWRQWEQAPAPASEELTEQDVLAAFIAKDVIDAAQYRRAFIISGPWCPLNEMELALARRGASLLQRYKLVRGERVPIWENAPIPQGAIASRYFGAGYIALQEYHCRYALVEKRESV